MRQYLASLLVAIAGIASTGHSLQVRTELSQALGSHEPTKPEANLLIPVKPTEIRPVSNTSRIKELLRGTFKAPPKMKRSVRHHLDLLKRDGALYPRITLSPADHRA